MRFGECERRIHDGENRRNALQLRSEHDHTRPLFGTVESNICKVEVETHQDALLLAADGDQSGVTCATELLLLHRRDVLASSLSERDRLTGQVFIKLEAKLRHAGSRSGGDGQDAFAREVRGVGDGREDMLRLQRRIIGEDPLA